MSSQVSGEGEVELKCFSAVGKTSPNGVPSLPFYRPREGPRVHERERERGKEEREKNREGGSLGAALPFSSTGRSYGPYR
jgi:hypothetical protein